MTDIAGRPPGGAEESIPSMPRTDTNLGTWAGILGRYEGRLAAAGVSPEDVPDPQEDDFPTFLAQLQVRDPVLAADLARSLRRLKDYGSLPSARSSRRRERTRRTRQAMLMREEEGTFVFDKRKAPMYGMAALALVVAPLMYFLSRPALSNTTVSTGITNKKDGEETPTSQDGTSVQDSKGVASAPGRTAAKAPQPAAGSSTTIPAPTEAGTTASNTRPPTASTPATASGLAQFRKEQAVTTSRETPSNSGILGQQFARPPVTAPLPVNTSDHSSPPGSVPSTAASRPDVWQPVPRATEEAPRFGSTVSTPAPAVVQTPPTSAAVPAPPTVFAAPQPAVTPPPVSASPRSTAAPQPEVRQAPPAVQVRRPAPPPVQVRAVSATPAAATPAQTPAPTAFGASVIPAAVPQPARERPVTSGLIYERERPSAQDSSSNTATAPAASPPLADTPLAASVAATVPFGAAPGAAARASGTADDSLPAETPFGSSAVNAASKLGEVGPFKNLQQVPGRLMTAINALTGGSVPVVVVTSDGGSFVGVGTINGQLARVDMVFRRYIDAKGTVYPVDAMAYTTEGRNLMQGVPASIQPVAPTLALDAAQNGVSALQEALMAALGAKAQSGTKIAVGDGAAISSDALPPLWQILAGGLGSTFQLPKNTQSIGRVAKVDSSTPMTVIVGLGGGL